MANVIGGIIGLTLTVIMVTAVLIPTIVGVNTTTWETSTVVIFGLSTLVAVAGLVYAIASFFGML